MPDNNKFSKANRLLSRPEFQIVFDAKTRIKSIYIVLHYRLTDQSEPRLGLIAAKRNIRTAVARNRVRRIAREVFRTHKALIGIRDIVLVIHAQAAKATNQELHQCLNNLFKQLSDR